MLKKFCISFLAAILMIAFAGCANTPYAPDANQFHLNIFSFLSSDTVWDRLSDNYELEQRPYHKALLTQIKWFATHKTYLQRLASNASPYIYYIYQQTRVRDMPAELALLPMIESAYNAFDYSGAGAVGLWQMMPGTAAGFGLPLNWWYDGRRDVVASTKAALDYLKYLHKFFNGNWLLAIAAYDSGEGTVLDAVRHNKALHRPTDFWDLPLPQETKAYVPKLLALAIIFAHPADYGLKLPKVPDSPYFGVVTLHSQIDFLTIAHLANVSENVVRMLNPGFRRWATAPGDTYQLLLPIKSINTFNKEYAQLPKGERVTWRHHVVKSGETLDSIAHHYKTTANILERVNSLRSSMIHPKQNLLVPLATHGDFSRSHASGRYHNIAEEKIPGPHRIIHIVSAHDNLWTIARRFGVKVSQLEFWNKLKSYADIHIGQRLEIWIQPHTYNTTGYIKHRVRSGDSLDSIAKHFRVSVEAIKRANDLSSNTIRIGESLKIPYRTMETKHYHNVMLVHHVQSGETINEIAKRYHVSADSLLHWNHLHRSSVIKVGQRLVIYTRR